MQLPSWARSVGLSLISALVAGSLVAVVCVVVFTQKINQFEAEDQHDETDELHLADDGGGDGVGGVAGAADKLPVVQAKPSKSLLRSYSQAAVAVDSGPCSTVGRSMFERGGNAVDAAVAALFCNGVVKSQSSGVGGGFIMTISLANGTRMSLMAREAAPALSNTTMFSGKGRSSKYGALAAGIPGEVLGAWEAKKRLGNPELSWSDLLQPSIDLCSNGITVDENIARYMKTASKYLKTDPGLMSEFINPETGEVWIKGDVYTRPKLAKTLKIIAEKGAEELYTGELATKLVEDISEAGGIISLDDLKNYRVSWSEPVVAVIPGTNYTILSSPPPGSGVIMSTILSLAGSYRPDPLDARRPLLWHRFTEACKYAYAKRTILGDWMDPELSAVVKELVSSLTSPQTIKELAEKISDEKTFDSTDHYGAEYYSVDDAGTTHLSILSPAGDAVSVTSTVNLLYGGKFMSTQTGIILNNQMDDFSFPGLTNAFGVKPSPNNFVAPGRRPVSSMSPTIVVDGGGRVVAVVGASGGTKITTAVAQVLLRLLFLGEDVKEAVDARRLHHQLSPMKLKYEFGTTRNIVEGLEKFGHDVEMLNIGGSTVQAIFVDGHTGRITANSDFRKGGSTDGF